MVLFLFYVMVVFTLLAQVQVYKAGQYVQTDPAQLLLLLEVMIMFSLYFWTFFFSCPKYRVLKHSQEQAVHGTSSFCPAHVEKRGFCANFMRTFAVIYIYCSDKHWHRRVVFILAPSWWHLPSETNKCISLLGSVVPTLWGRDNLEGIIQFHNCFNAPFVLWEPAASWKTLG